MKIIIFSLSLSLVSHLHSCSPPAASNSDHYITSVTWIDSSTLSISWMNRAQNVTILSKCSEEIDWMCEKVGLTFEQAPI